MNLIRNFTAGFVVGVRTFKGVFSGNSLIGHIPCNGFNEPVTYVRQ